MEGIRGNTSPENHDNDSEKKKKDPKKRFNFRAPIPAAEESKADKPEAVRPSSLQEALAALTIESRKKAEAKAEPEEGKKKPEEPIKPELNTESEQFEAETLDYPDLAVERTEHREADEHNKTKVEAETEKEEAEADTETETGDEEYEALPIYEKRSSDLNGGETLIDLTGKSAGVILYGSQPQKPREESPSEERQEPAFEHSVAEQGAYEQAEIPAETEAVVAEQIAEPSETVATMSQSPMHEIQPEKPHAEAGEPPVPPNPELVAAGGNVPPIPPEARDHYAMSESPFTPYNVVRSGPDNERVATKQDVEDAVYYATKAGTRRGLVTGLFVGGLYEHFKHRRREKKAEKRYKKQHRELEQARTDYKFGLQEQERKQSELKAQLVAAESRPTTVAQETRPGASPQEKREAEEKQLGKLIIRTPEQIAAESPEQLLVPDGHRIETSAWHSIEVDARTGRVVENPAFEYGQEFHHERAQESKGVEEPTTALASSPDTMTELAAAAKIPSASTRDSSFAPASLPNATMQGPPVSPKDKAKAAISSLTKPDNPTNSGPLWPWLLALGVIVLLLMILL